MAVAAQSVILHKCFPKLSKLDTLLLHSHFNFHSISHSSFRFRQTHQLKVASCASKTTISDVQLADFNPTDSATTSWSEFASKVSGEWDGHGADFSREGQPIELPESVVPEAYREWEVKVFDWQTQCPTFAVPEDHVMFYKSIKLLPTVGCEADAATRYSIDERHIGGADNKVSAFAYESTGSYVAVWQIGHGTHTLLELEHCLINPLDKESRIRIFQVAHVDNISGKMEVESIRVFREQWYGPFRNGEQLGGCAIRDSAFASTAATEASEVAGIWEGPIAVASFNRSHANSVQQLLENGMQKSVRDERGVVLLPKRLWSSLKQSKDGETWCEVGWLFDQGRAITSRCIFTSDANLKEVSVAQETAA